MIAFLIAAIIFLIILLVIIRKKLQSIINNLTKDKENLNVEVINLDQRNQALSKYQGIVDTELKANEILAEAEVEANLIIVNAKQELENAIIQLDNAAKEAKAIIEQADEKAQGIAKAAYVEGDELRKEARKELDQARIDAILLRQNAIDQLDKATKEAKIIIGQANKDAQEIAGDAYKAMQNAAELEKTAKAMKNIIEGYGDKYLVPTYSLLDDLADEFGHTEGGEKLKFAREKTRLMIKNGTSASCDYVEAYRRTTAINFILDAFNGKVDSILSKVKKDNYGILEQKIKDAYQVVNNNGKAFRNAFISQGYLNARIDELKWAVITQELKWHEQEEQRRIKEQIREEEKARREFEKAIRDAQKEEEILKKLIEKAQKEVAQASEEQKSKYEEKLNDLENKLKVAEEKNQRAISMAQQTKSGNVYVISNIGSFGENVYKIGMTRRLEPLDRVRELGDASVPFEFDVHTMIFSDNAPKLERELHKKFLRLQMNKVNPRKEFFKVTLADIKAEVESLNINAKWTIVSEARQYRESLAIEQAILNDKQKELEWEKHQQIESEVMETEPEDVFEEISTK